MAREIENWQAHDPAWSEENWKKEEGCFTRRGSVFVPKDKLLERAIDNVNEDSYLQSEFIEMALDLIERTPELQELFLQWFYKDYEKE